MTLKIRYLLNNKNYLSLEFKTGKKTDEVFDYLGKQQLKFNFANVAMLVLRNLKFK